MCVLIDTCAIHCVFGVDTKNHHDFEPILSWVRYGDGKIIIGGSKYKYELKACIGKYSGLLAEFRKAGKLIYLDDGKVDARQRDVEKLENDPSFDDPHLVAIVIESGCRIICTNEVVAIPFLLNPRLYPRSTMRPKIYKGVRNASLLKDRRNIAPICCK